MESTNLLGKFVWHDLMSTDPVVAEKFYTSLFPEWKIVAHDMGANGIYREIHAAGVASGGIVALPTGAPVPSHWIGYVGVSDCAATLTRMEALGGKSLMPMMDVPNVGKFAAVADPQGAALMPFEIAVPIHRPEMPSPGQFCWDELMAADIASARTFYQEIFGWKSTTKSLGAIGEYTIFEHGGVMVGGGMTKPADMPAPPHWVTYLAVDHVDARTHTAESLGAHVVVPPSDIPDTGRFSWIADPTGAIVCLFASFPPAPGN